MLLQTIIPPTLLAQVPPQLAAQREFCNRWISILRELSENCVIFFPGNCAVKNDYTVAIQNWPSKYKPRAVEIFSQLEKRNRFQEHSNPYLPCQVCSIPSCAQFLGLCASIQDSYYFTTSTCFSCSLSQITSERYVDTEDYSLSRFSIVRGQEFSHAIIDRQWNKSDFENRILRPVLLTAKHVKIYDRYIGRSIEISNGVQFSEKYKDTLQWIAQIFANSGGIHRGGVFEVYCGYFVSRSFSFSRHLVRQEVSRVEADIRALTGVPVKIFLKEESSNSECPHGRFLVTDQISLSVERGFDILWTIQRMRSNRLHPNRNPTPVRDITITRCEDCSSVEREFRTLPNF